MNDTTEQKDRQELAGEALESWQKKIRGVTVALIAVAIGLVAIPVTLLELIPFLSALAIPSISAAILATIGLVALPIGTRVGRAIVPDPPRGSDGSGADIDRSRAPPDLMERARAEAGARLTDALDEWGVSKRVDEYRHACLVATKGAGATTEFLLTTASALLLGVAFIPTPFPAPLSLFVAPGAALAALASACSHRMPTLVEGREPPEDEKDAVSEADPDRATGLDLVDDLRRSSIYRRQVRFEHELEGRDEAELVFSERGLERLTERFPRLHGRWLERTGIDELTESQTKALDRVLDSGGRKSPTDHVFIGPPGSGRSTLANLLTLGTLLHREGTIYCLAAESVERSVVQSSRSGGGARSAHREFERWVEADRDVRDRVQIAFSDRNERLEFDSPADIYFTDIQRFSKDLLRSTGGEEYARRALQRMRYLVIDHPDRLTRHELIRLRSAIARVRVTAELLGQQISVLLMLPRFDNVQAFSKWLLNNDNPTTSLFSPWHYRSHVVGWHPPFEHVGETPEGNPQFGRADFTEEIQAIVSRLARHADDLHDRAGSTIEPMHIGVVDEQPLLGPEVRDHLHQNIVDEVRRSGRGSGAELRIDVDLTIVGTSDIAVDRTRGFDVVVCLGIGAYPGRLVNKLRPVLRRDGVLILVSDSKPEDLASIRELSTDDWRPPTPHVDSARRSDDSFFGEPALLTPAHSDSIVASELCELFTDFDDIPIPASRLFDAFPGDFTRNLIESWVERGDVQSFRAFDRTTAASEAPTPERYLVHRDDRLRTENYDLPWGCTSRDVVSVEDATAHSGVTIRRREVASHVDLDRLFIDLFPSAMIKVPPNSVEVRDYRPREVPEEEEDGLGAVERGTLELRQPWYSESIPIDRRKLRTEVTAEDEFLPDRERYERYLDSRQTSGGDGDALALGRAIHLAEREDEEPATRRLFETATQTSTVSSNASLRYHVGSWALRVREHFRDVVVTEDRLIEDPEYVDFESSDQLLREALRRTYRAPAISVFIESIPERDHLHGPSEEGPGVDDTLDDRPAIHGIARLVDLYLSRQFLGFDGEFRVDVIENAGAPGGLSPWRIVVRGLRRRELTAGPQIQNVLESALAGPALEWMHDLLVDCDCEDGCAACCAGLGTIPAPRETAGATHWREGDRVSRRGAYVLVCALLGRRPDWKRFRRSSRGDLVDVPKPVGDEELGRLVERIIGTEARSYRDGEWHELFGRHMPLDELAGGSDDVATANWYNETPDRDVSSDTVGFYDPAARDVFVESDRPEREILSTILHEYVHNWQYESDDGFNHQLHRLSPEAQRYFEGILVLEGHARWCQHVYALENDRGPLHTVDDDWPLDQYKVGWLLCMGIEKNFGERGLFLWLQHGEEFDPDEFDSPPRSRHSKLPDLSFSLEQALEAFDLLDEARYGKFDGIDILEADTPDEELTDDRRAADAESSSTTDQE